MKIKLDRIVMRINGQVVLDTPIDLVLIQELMYNKSIFDEFLAPKTHIEIVIKREYEKISYFTWLSKLWVTKELPIIQALRDTIEEGKDELANKDEQKRP